MTVMNTKIRKITYNFFDGYWDRMFGGVIWSENGEYLFTYLYNYYTPNPYELMVTTGEEKQLVESTINEIIQNNLTSKTDQCSSNDDANKKANNLDYSFDDVEPDDMGYGECRYGDCTVIHDSGEKDVLFIDKISIQTLHGILERMSSDRGKFREQDEKDTLEVHSIDVWKERECLYSIVYDIMADVYFIYDYNKLYGNIRIISKQLIEKMFADFRQRSDFSYVSLYLEINEKHFLFGSDSEQTKFEAIVEDNINDDCHGDLLEGPVKATIINQKIVIEEVILLVVKKNPDTIKILLKNGDVFFSKRNNLLKVYHQPKIHELKKISEENGFTLYKRWDKNWVKYLEQHLITVTNWKMKSNPNTWGELVHVYYLFNNHLVRLGAYSEGRLNLFPEDENAVGVLEGMMRYNSVFWE